MMEYSDSSMFWLTNRVANFAYLRYDAIAGEVRGAIDEWENNLLSTIHEIDKVAVQILEDEPAGATARTAEFLTEFSVETAGKLFDRWAALDKYLLVKYIDGNVKKQNADGSFLDNGNGARIPEMPDFPGYDQRWKNNVAAEDDGTLRVPAAGK